ncbi:MAG TPA: hypothetical protein VJ719_04215 [Chthoniobacterales bacterium]|nr:hypothetical protein [Chthoniobacterales bacterium]
MDFSKHPIFAAEYVGAILLAIVLTMLFASAIRARNCRSWRELPALVWLFAAGSAGAGVLIIFLGEVIARWLPVAVSMVSAIVIAFGVIRALGFRYNKAAAGSDCGSGARIAIGLYFCVVLLLFVGTIFARFYFLRLG